MPVPQRGDFIVGWAGEPASTSLIDNGLRAQGKTVYVCEDRKLKNRR